MHPFRLWNSITLVWGDLTAGGSCNNAQCPWYPSYYMYMLSLTSCCIVVKNNFSRNFAQQLELKNSQGKSMSSDFFSSFLETKFPLIKTLADIQQCQVALKMNKNIWVWNFYTLVKELFFHANKTTAILLQTPLSELRAGLAYWVLLTQVKCKYRGRSNCHIFTKWAHKMETLRIMTVHYHSSKHFMLSIMLCFCFNFWFNFWRSVPSTLSTG